MLPHYVLTPFHVYNATTPHITKAEYDDLFTDIDMDCYLNIPNWSYHIPRLLKYHQKTQQVIWIVSDWMFNNNDYTDLILRPRERLDRWGYRNNVNRFYMDPHHIEFFGKVSLSMIDDVIAWCPDIKLIFWCLYAHEPPYPEHLQYTSIKARYKDNIIDIDAYTTPEDFKKCHITYQPTKQGYQLLSHMIRDA